MITCVRVLLLGEEAEGGDLGEGAAADKDDQDHPRPVRRRSLPAVVAPPQVGSQGLTLDHTKVWLLETINIYFIKYVPNLVSRYFCLFNEHVYAGECPRPVFSAL